MCKSLQIFKLYIMAKPKENERLVFAQWVATPSALREPSSQKEFAKEFAIDESTLSRWKKEDEFWDEVRREIKRWAKNKTANVINAIYKSAIDIGEAGQASNAKLWLQWVDDWSEKIKVENENEELRQIGNNLQSLFDDYEERINKLEKRPNKSDKKPKDKRAS